jgi:hypothetical protein
VCFAGCK